MQMIVDQYRETCSILRETYLSGDYRRGNREGKKIDIAFAQLEDDKELAIRALPLLFDDDNGTARMPRRVAGRQLEVCAHGGHRQGDG